MKIEKLENITIAYMRNIGEYGCNNEELMDRFKRFLNDNGLFNKESVILGIALDDPNVTPAGKQRYDVGIIVDENTLIGLDTRKIDDGQYAVFEAAHTKEGITSFWQNIVQLTSDLQADRKKPIIERYAKDKITDGLCEFCVPLIAGDK